MKRSYFLLTICALFSFIPAWSLPYKISYLTADDGLSRNLVEHIYRDSHGFIWISTGKGLNRYDAYEFIQFNSRSTENPLKSDNVFCVEEDKWGDLWIGTENGLFIRNYVSGKIINADLKTNSTLKFTGKYINFIKSDDQGDIWIGYENGLVKLHFDANNQIETREIFNSSSPAKAVVQFNGSIFAATENEVFRLIKQSDGKYNKVSADERLNQPVGLVNVMYSDNDFIWIGTANGLYKYEPTSETLILYQTNLANNQSLTSNYITDICKNHDGSKLLIGTLIGLNIYDYRTDTFEHITSESNPSGLKLNNNFISCIFVDENTIWIGTEKGGINLLTPDFNLFNNFVHSPENPASLSKNPVNSIYEDESGNLWVGTVEGGLNLRKKGATTFQHFYSQLGNDNTLSHNSVSTICRDFNGDYWFGTWGRGINRVWAKDKDNPVFQRFYHSESDRNTILNDFVAAMVSDVKNRGLWVGTRNGLDFLDLETERVLHILDYLPANEHIRFITGMYIDKKQRLWLGTGNGLYCIYLDKTNLKQNRISYKHFHYELTNPSSGVIEKINCILETKEGKLWFGSNGNGIYRMNEKGSKVSFENFDESIGLLDNVVYGILEDDAGKIWLSTDKGLCVYDPNQESFRSYTSADGLISNQFYWDAFFKGSDGKLYFGSVAGFTSFDPLKTTPVLNKNKASITRIKVLNNDIYPNNEINVDRYLEFENNNLVKIRLKEAEKAFSVEFSALFYYLPDKIKYAYRLKGFDNDWKEVTSDRRFANFTNIKSGNYELEIKCTNADGSWSDQITTIEIKVIPPFYKTWWFILLFAALIVYIVYSYYMYRISSLKKQEIHLRQLVEERTLEIELQKKKLEEQALQLQSNVKVLIDHQDEVSRQNEMLIKQNHKITHQKEELEKLTLKLEEATIDKIGFFTNITHEFRTPITLILGPVERSLKLSTNPKVLEQLHIVRRNSKLLLSLINQLMDFRKIESGKMELIKTQQNFVGFLDDIIMPFEDMGKDRGIIFKKQYRINPPEFMFDRDNMQKVLGNLLSNAIKFTPEHGQINIIASTYFDKSDQKEKLYVAVKDTGKGVPEEEKERIFERFYQSKQNIAYSGTGQSGTGIGLYLCKQIIELHNGKIEVLNQHTGGSCFRFIIPIERRLSTLVSLDGKPMEMIVASHPDEPDTINNQISKGNPVLLIVEDNSDMRQYIRSILSSSYNVLEASNGLVGIEVTNRYQPDLIISDIMMPEMDGLEFCKRVKSNFATSHIPIILLTAKSSTDTQIESFHQGADAFLVKPFDEDLLKAIIGNMSEKRKRLQMSFAENMDTKVLNFDDESLDKKFMDKVLKITKENYTSPEFDVTEFIDAMGISRSLLHKKLTNLAGQSASRFIRIYRLNIARELIIKNRASHTLNISEIAYEVGFNDPKYFTRCFTKHFGIQPSAFMEMEK